MDQSALDRFKFEEITLTFDYMNALMPTLRHHWAESGVFQDERAISVDVERVVALAGAGKLRSFVAYDRDRQKEIWGPISYHDFLIAPSLQYKDWPSAMSHVYYTMPGYRGDDIAWSLYEFAKMTLKRDGIRSVKIASKVHLTDDKGKPPFFANEGCLHIENVYEEML